MRRAPAFLLLAIFAGTLFLPLLEARTRPELPACCRRDGQHRCASMPGAAAPGSKAVSAGSRCPLFPKSFGAWAGSAAIAPAIAARIVPTFPPADAPQLAVDPPRPDTHNRANETRGPPILFA